MVKLLDFGHGGGVSCSPKARGDHRGYEIWGWKDEDRGSPVIFIQTARGSRTRLVKACPGLEL